MNTNNLKKKKYSLKLRRHTKPTALFISALFVLSVLLAFSPTAVQAATTSSQVAVSSATASSSDAQYSANLAIDGVESTSNYWGTNALITAGQLPQWLRLDLGNTKTFSQITTHFYDGDSRTYTYNIQASTDGSNWNTIVPSKTGSSIVTDTFNQVTARYVRITITGNTAWNAGHIEEIKIYQTTTQTSTPTPTPTPTPTQTPTPTPMSPVPPNDGYSETSAKNLAPIPSSWSVYDVRPDPYNVNNNLDYGVLGPNGEPSVRSDSVLGGATYHGYRASIYNPYRELDSVWYSVRPGDHIVFSVWMKTGPSGGQDPNKASNNNMPAINYVAACLGWDWYGSNGRIGANVVYDGKDYMPYGIGWSTDWTFRQYDLIVPAKADDGTGNMYPINGIILWLGSDALDSGQVWFADARFYINP